MMGERTSAGERTYAMLPDVGEAVDLEVNLHEGVVGFRPEFIYDDGILREKHRSERGADDVYHGYELSEGKFRSVRRFMVAQGEEVALYEGERWHGRVVDWRVSDRKSRDERIIIYVTVHDLQRHYSWSEEREDDNLIIFLKCGDQVLRQRVIPLKEQLYRFREEGDPAKTITEIMALGTEQRPIARTDLPRRTTLKELVDADIAVFKGNSRTREIREFATEKFSATIQVVDSKTLEKYKNIPFVERNTDSSRVLARR